MRHSAVTSVQSCASPLPNSRRYVAVQLLTREALLFSVETKCRLSELNARVCDRMCLQGLQDPALFGLAIPIDGEYVFVDPDNKVSKYAPKAWKSSHENGLDGSNRPLLQFSFRVKFYVDSHLLLKDRVSRHHYYLQLRENVLVHRQACSAETCLLLAGWALQADVGDFTDTTGGAYFQPVEYFPKWVITKVGVDYILEKTAAAHRDNRSMAKTQAELAYIREASAMEAPHNLHLYRLKRRKAEPAGSVLLGICPNGIELYEEKNLARKLLASFVWTNINNLTFEKKKFEIGALTQKFTFYTGDDEKAKHLFLLCKDIHMFTQTLKERLAEIKQNSYEERRSTDSSLHFPSSLRAGWEYLSKQGSSTDQRISVISNTSSNTTSGIVSDRTAHSLDESDDDLHVGSMGKTPPPESVESGVESLTRSRSQLDSNSLRSSQRSPPVEEDTIPAPRCLTDGSKVALRLPAATAPAPPSAASAPVSASAEQPAQDSSHGGGAHSSSQHAVGTVRARFPLVKPPAPPTAQQHLQPPPGSCDHTQKHMFSSPTNCCSTCVEVDSVSVCSDEPGSPCVACKTRRKTGKSEQRCTCGGAGGGGGGGGGGGSDGASITSGSTLYARQGDSPRHAASGSATSESFSLQHLSQSSMASGVSAASTADSTRALDDGDDAASLTAESASVYNGSEDYAALDGESDYVAFYKAAAVGVSGGSAACDEEEEDEDADNVSVRSGASATSNSSSQAATLDYSVHSAHTSVGSVVTTPGSFPRRTTVSSTFDTDSDYVQVPYDRLGQLVAETAAPTAVAMATVTTVTRVGLAQSCQAAEAAEPPPPPAPAPPTPASVPATDALRVVSVPAASAPPSSEAPARFITTRPLVTVFRAHASAAVRQTPSFAAPTVRRVRRGVVPRFVGTVPPAATLPKPRPVHAAAAAAAAVAAGLELPHEPLLPVIRGNNYLDVRASQPALPSAAQLYANLSSGMTLEAGQMYANLANRAGKPGMAVYMNSASSTPPIEQFERQLLSDSDYVIYPLKDPAISRQEYMDAKDCSSLAAGGAATLPLPPPPPYRAPRGGAATVAAAALYGGSRPGSSSSSLYSSLYSDGLGGSLRGLPVQHQLSLSSHSLASTASRSGSWEPYSEAEMYRTAAALAPAYSRRATVTRARSDDNLLSAASAEFLATCTSNGRPPPPYSSQARTLSSQNFSVSKTLPSQLMQQRQRRQHQQQQQQQQALQQQQQLQRQQLQRQQQKLLLQQEQHQSGSVSQQTLLKHQQLIRRHLEQRTQPAAGADLSTAAAAAAIAASLSVDPHQAASATLPNPRTQARVTPLATQQQRRLLQQAQRQQQQQQLIQKQQQAQRLQEQAQQEQQLQLQLRQQQQQQQQQRHRQQSERPPAAAADSELDLDSLRAASQELDLPLISALFNDRLLRHSGPGRPQTWHEAAVSGAAQPSPPAALQRLPGPSSGQSALARAQRGDAPAAQSDAGEGAAPPPPPPPPPAAASHAHSTAPAQLASAKSAGRRHLPAPAVR